MSVGRSLVPGRCGLVLSALVSVLGACAHGVEPSAEGPALITIGAEKDAGAAGAAPGTGGQAGSTDPTGASGSSGAAGSEDPGVGGAGGDGGSSSPDDAGESAAGNSGGGGAGGVVAVEAGPAPVPTDVAIGAQTTPSATRAPSAGGTAYSDVCPANQALIGFKGTVDAAGGMSYLRSVQGVCGNLAVTGSGPYMVTIAQAGTLPVRESASAVAQSITCLSNQVMVGFGGRSGGFIDALTFRCAPLTIGGTAPSYKLGLGTVTTTGIIGGATGGVDFASIDCGAGMVAVGQAPHGGAAIDSFGLVCATPSLTVK
jgi:hypothetical protein